MEMGGRAGWHHTDPTVPLLQCARLPCAQPTTMSPPSDTSSHLCLVRALGRGEYVNTFKQRPYSVAVPAFSQVSRAAMTTDGALLNLGVF